jgi:hypothetical protein
VATPQAEMAWSRASLKEPILPLLATTNDGLRGDWAVWAEILTSGVGAEQ